MACGSRLGTTALAGVLLTGACGCLGPGGRGSSPRQLHPEEIVRDVHCLYDVKPWLTNLDREGDRDAEGIRYRVFLVDGRGRTALRDGTLHVEIYRVDPAPNGQRTRTLVNDYHYLTSDVHRIRKPGELGPGYFLYLAFADKHEVLGREIEIQTSFEDPFGNKARGATKPFRVPKVR